MEGSGPIEGNYEQASSSSKVAALSEFGYRGPLPGSKLLHEEVAIQWVIATGASREMAYANAWFFLELMVKSMGQHIGSGNRVYLPRKMRFSPEFVEELRTLTGNLTTEIITRAGKDMRQAKHINASLAFFLRDSLSLMDRSFVLGLIRSYVRQLGTRIASPTELALTLMHLRLEFLRILASHEHLVVLNLPWLSPALPPLLPSSSGPPASPSPSDASEGSADGSSSSGTGTAGAPVGSGLGPAAQLSRERRSRHWLIGLLLGDLATALQSPSARLQSQAAGLMLNLLRSHDLDPRYMEPSAIRSRVASLYLPLVGIILDSVGLLHDPYGKRSPGGGGARPSSYVGPNHGLNPNVALAISGFGGSISGPLPVSQSFGSGTAEASPLSVNTGRQLSLETTRELLLSVAWVLKSLEKGALMRFLGGLSSHRLTQLLDVLQLAVSCFEYRGPAVAQLARQPSQSSTTAAAARQSFREEGSRRTPSRSGTPVDATPASPAMGGSVRWRRGAESRASGRQVEGSRRTPSRSGTPVDATPASPAMGGSVRWRRGAESRASGRQVEGSRRTPSRSGTPVDATPASPAMGGSVRWRRGAESRASGRQVEGSRRTPSRSGTPVDATPASPAMGGSVRWRRGAESRASGRQVEGSRRTPSRSGTPVDATPASPAMGGSVRWRRGAESRASGRQVEGSRRTPSRSGTPVDATPASPAMGGSVRWRRGAESRASGRQVEGSRRTPSRSGTPVDATPASPAMGGSVRWRRGAESRASGRQVEGSRRTPSRSGTPVDATPASPAMGGSVRWRRGAESRASGRQVEGSRRTPSRSGTPVDATPASPAMGGSVRWRRGAESRASGRQADMIASRMTTTLSLGGGDGAEELEEALEGVREGALATELSAVVLETLEGVRKVVVGSAEGFTLAPLIMRVLLHMMACNQSTVTNARVMGTLRAMILGSGSSGVEQNPDACAVEEETGALCLQFLRHCASRLSSDRSQAAGSLYLLMRQAFLAGPRLARVKVEVTVALSSLVSGARVSETHLRKALRTLLAYSEADSLLSHTTFSHQVSSLVFNLHMILSDTVAMKDFHSDFEMLIDRMYRIAKGYQNSPDLRLTWLLSMGSKQAEAGNFAEAAHCALHAAALSAEYLHMLQDREYLPKGAVSFLPITENVLEESAVSDDVLSPEEEGICESRHFTEEGLISLLEQAGELLYSAQLYESLHRLYSQLLLPILTERRDYQRVAGVHGRLAEAMGRLEAKVTRPALPLRTPPDAGDKRVFGTFFRVGFYGHLLGDLDGLEFVYKEPGITKLAEISHRLLAFYSERLGTGAVELLKDSSNVNRSKLQPDKAYIQVTYVEPYQEVWEQRHKRPSFEQHYNLRRFIYSTPFTTDGAAHGDLASQQKRKTMLETELGFPYLKTRLRVVSREQWVLSPIEVALEDVEGKTAQLQAALAAQPLDPKMLQMVLQVYIPHLKVALEDVEGKTAQLQAALAAQPLDPKMLQMVLQVYIPHLKVALEDVEGKTAQLQAALAAQPLDPKMLQMVLQVYIPHLKVALEDVEGKTAQLQAALAAQPLDPKMLQMVLQVYIPHLKVALEDVEGKTAQLQAALAAQPLDPKMLQMVLQVYIPHLKVALEDVEGKTAQLQAALAAQPLDPKMLQMVLQVYIPHLKVALEDVEGKTAQLQAALAAQPLDPKMLQMVLQVYIPHLKVALEDVEGKTAQLQAALAAQPLDPKMLQMVLQVYIPHLKVALEDVEGKTAQLQAALAAQPLDPKMLQMVLQVYIPHLKVALEDVEGKTAQLQAALAAQPLDPKMLQMVLQVYIPHLKVALEDVEGKTAQLQAALAAQPLDPKMLQMVLQVYIPHLKVALEDVEGKTAQLQAALAAQPLDPKMLQMVLQGCVGTTVNQGPMEVAKVFLAEAAAAPRPLSRHQNALRLAFKDFSKKCADALRENKRFIGPDQREYQKELERNYIAFTEALAGLVGNAAPGVAALKRAHRAAADANALVASC